jgi:hypothetical protein
MEMDTKSAFKLNPVMIVEAKYNLGTTCYKLKEYYEAKKYYQSSIDIL